MSIEKLKFQSRITEDIVHGLPRITTESSVDIRKQNPCTSAIKDKEKFLCQKDS